MLRRVTGGDHSQPQLESSRVRIGDFEVDLRAGELRAGGETLRLQEQPFQIFLMMLKRQGEVVTREEIQSGLWPDGTIVDFHHSVNTAVKKLRRALRDSADSPRYIETVARRGYRLLVSPQPVRREQVQAVRKPSQQAELQERLRRLERLVYATIKRPQRVRYVLSSTDSDNTRRP